MTEYTLVSLSQLPFVSDMPHYSCCSLVSHSTVSEAYCCHWFAFSLSSWVRHCSGVLLPQNAGSNSDLVMLYTDQN